MLSDFWLIGLHTLFLESHFGGGHRLRLRFERYACLSTVYSFCFSYEPSNLKELPSPPSPSSSSPALHLLRPRASARPPRSFLRSHGRAPRSRQLSPVFLASAILLGRFGRCPSLSSLQTRKRRRRSPSSPFAVRCWAVPRSSVGRSDSLLIS
jgi:hypothetical protein